MENREARQVRDNQGRVGGQRGWTGKETIRVGLEDRQVGQVRDTQGRVGEQRCWTGKEQSGSGLKTERLDR